MCAKHFHQFTIIHFQCCTCHTLSNVPVASKKGRWTTVKCISLHSTLHYWPFREYCQSSTKDTTPVELAIWQEMLRPLPDSFVIFLSPAFLKSDNLRDWIGIGKFCSNS